VAGIGLIVLLGLIVVLLIWRKNKNKQLIPPQIPPQETIVESPLTPPTPTPVAPESPTVSGVVPPPSDTNAQENK